ncbi:hypothetical protein GGI21_004507, partial [Coemansia aciculifera]
EHAYHWWDVFTSNAVGLVKSKSDDTNYALSHAQHDAVEAGKHVTSKAEYIAQDMSRKIQQNAADAKQQAQDNVEYIGIRVQEEAEKLGQTAMQEAADMKQKTEDDAKHAAKRVKQVGQDAFAYGAKQATENVQTRGGGWLRRTYNRISHQAEALGSATRGAGNHLRSRLKAGLAKLHDLASTSGDSTSSEWPKTLFGDGSHEAIVQYAQHLSNAAQYANAQLKEKVEAQGAVLESIAGSYVFMRLPLAGLYGSLVALMLIYLVSNAWRHMSDESHKTHQRAEAAAASAETTCTLQQENTLTSEAMVTASMHLTVVPMVVMLLIIMELNGSPSWLLIVSYTSLLAGMLAAANPALLASIWDVDGMGNIEQRLAVGVTFIVAIGCLAQTVYG